MPRNSRREIMRSLCLGAPGGTAQEQLHRGAARPATFTNYFAASGSGLASFLERGRSAARVGSRALACEDPDTYCLRPPVSPSRTAQPSANRSRASDRVRSRTSPALWALRSMPSIISANFLISRMRTMGRLWQIAGCNYPAEAASHAELKVPKGVIEHDPGLCQPEIDARRAVGANDNVAAVETDGVSSARHCGG
jgi:hypothetical protein